MLIYFIFLFQEDESNMFVGCGDNKVYCLDIETQTAKVKMVL